MCYLSKHTDLLPSRPVSSDGRENFKLIAKAPRSRSNEKSDEYITPEIYKLHGLRYVLCTSRIVAVVNLYLYNLQVEETINGMTSLAAVSVYWSFRACKRVKRRAPTLSWCHQRSIELHPSFISPCNGLLCQYIKYGECNP